MNEEQLEAFLSKKAMKISKVAAAPMIVDPAKKVVEEEMVDRQQLGDESGEIMQHIVWRRIWRRWMQFQMQLGAGSV
jgi:hypothetical protein